MLKSELRNKYKTIRQGVKNRSEAERIITDRLLGSDLFTNCDSVFLYASSKGEVSTVEIFRFCLAEGKKVAFPVCSDSEGNMEFYFVKSETDLINGMYSIMEPDTSQCCKASWSKKTLVVVPALAFDTVGNRLGYGKGYYDRFLNVFNGKSVGLCFDECLCDYLPVNAYDKKVNSLITDKRIYIFQKSKEE